MVIKGKFKYLKWEDKQKVSFFFSQRLRHPYGGEKGEEERKKRKKRKERKEKNKGEKDYRTGTGTQREASGIER